MPGYSVQCLQLKMNLYICEVTSSNMKFNALTYQRPKVIRPLKQRGSSNKTRDSGRTALPPGKRVSRTGHIYFESRKNRTDLPGKSI